MSKEIFIKLFHWLTHPGKIFRLRMFLNSRRLPKSSPSLQKKLIEKKPIILFSSCENSLRTGDIKYNGGIKVYNLWAKLLRQHGYEAYIVTYDGRYQPWLIEHQPCVSLATVKQWKKEGRPLKFVTAWLDAKAFIDLADQIYFHDCEATYTATIHSSIFQKLLKSRKIRAISTNSRFQQAWYLGKFNLFPKLIPDWSDEEYWFPDQKRRESGVVGYMRESETSELEIEQIVEYCRKNNVDTKFIEIKGDEKDVIEMMQKCDFYLGLNPGKHPLLGEGCPRSQQEAMHAGCVVIAYDVNGNREYLIDGYNGFLVPRKNTNLLATHLVNLMKNSELKEKIRKRSINLVSKVFTSLDKFPLLREFLELR
jgi:glycosyltransferase involved in cell wall biosynthesis